MASIFNFLFGGCKEAPESIKILDQQSFKEAVNNAEQLQLVDVRTAREYQVGHIEKAQNIDFFQANKFAEAFNKLDKDRPVFIYCRSGNRSQKAARRLNNMGFKEIYDLKGGYLGWKN